MNKDIQDLLEKACNLIDTNKFDEANEIYKNAINQFPESHQLYHSFAISLIKQNQTKLAIEKFHQALELDPQNPNYNSDLGEMYRRIKNLIYQSSLILEVLK